MEQTTYSYENQDLFAINISKRKRDGYFVEIGSNHPIENNNTYLLEKHYNWKGIMIELMPDFVELYKTERPNSTYVIQDATTIDYKQLFEANNAPKNIDFLQIDLEEHDRSTLTTLQLFDQYIFDHYKFATITFEHDVYRGNIHKTLETSREIFTQRGYVLVFPNVTASCCKGQFEDWYVHPDLVDMDFVNRIKRNVPLYTKTIVDIMDSEYDK